MSDCVEKGCTDEATTRDRCDSHYRRRLRMGFYGYRDPAAARAHITRLRNLGWTWEGIADAAGLSTYVAHQLAAGATRRLWPESETAILTVPLVPFDSHRSIDSTGTRRRVNALAWLGWPCAEVAERAGIKACTLRTVIQPNRRISFALARRVAAVYEDLCMTQGPSPYAAGKARKLGFFPPLAWGDRIDDPKARPAGVRRDELAA